MSAQPVPLVTGIHDADLIAELEAARGSAGFEFVRMNCVRLQEERDRAARMSPSERRRTRAREILESDGVTPDNLRHIHSVLAICSLPYTRQPIEVREYERKHGRMSLTVEAGKLKGPDGAWVEQPLPYGSRARLLMLHLCSEAIRQKSPTIHIEDSLTAFIRAIGFPVTGGARGTLQAFKQQINALAACHMRIGVWNGNRSSTIHTTPFSRVDVWLPENPDQRMLWPSTLTFSLDFYQTLAEHALPVNVEAVRAFSNSPRKLDVLFWLGYRLKNLRKPLRISWAALAEQFGQGYARQRDFVADFTSEIGQVRMVFPRLPIDIGEDGLSLLPADPEVIAIPQVR